MAKPTDADARGAHRLVAHGVGSATVPAGRKERTPSARRLP
jgi:hypothetical protein